MACTGSCRSPGSAGDFIRRKVQHLFAQNPVLSRAATVTTAVRKRTQETEIRRFREASVTSDGMLSCYTPFLLAIVQRCVADSAAKTPLTLEQEDVPLPASGDSDNGNDDVVGTENENAHKIFEKDEEQQGHRAQGDSLCPWALCVEALWALSEYAVLSPGLASAEVLPLAAALAGDTTECPQVTTAG